MHQLTAKTDCSGGPCPDLTEDVERGKTGGQGYVPAPATLSPDLPVGEENEVRWEMDTRVFEDLLARHLTDAAVERILTRRRELAREAVPA